MSERSKRYPVEIRDRAVRMVLEHQHEYSSQWAAITSISAKRRCPPSVRLAKKLANLGQVADSAPRESEEGCCSSDTEITHGANLDIEIIAREHTDLRGRSARGRRARGMRSGLAGGGLVPRFEAGHRANFSGSSADPARL